jgi:hypothetical protein
MNVFPRFRVIVSSFKEFSRNDALGVLPGPWIVPKQGHSTKFIGRLKMNVFPRFRVIVSSFKEFFQK